MAIVCARIPVDLLVLVAAMIPSPGELFDDWWANSRYEASGYDDDLRMERGRRGAASGSAHGRSVDLPRRVLRSRKTRAQFAANPPSSWTTQCELAIRGPARYPSAGAVPRAKGRSFRRLREGLAPLSASVLPRLEHIL
jgi:hypothetical protein